MHTAVRRETRSSRNNMKVWLSCSAVVDDLQLTGNRKQVKRRQRGEKERERKRQMEGERELSMPSAIHDPSVNVKRAEQ